MGVRGTVLSDPHHVRRDLDMIQVALRKGWKVPATAMGSLPKECIKIATAKGDDGEYLYRPEVRVKAMQTVVMMHRDNLKGLSEQLKLAGIQLDCGQDSVPANVTVNLAILSADQLKVLYDARQKLLTGNGDGEGVDGGLGPTG